MYLFFSDLHGVPAAATALQAVVRRLNPEHIFFLGDAMAPYDSQEAATLFREIAPRLTAVTGNCDFPDQLTPFGIASAGDYAEVHLQGHHFFLTHGHRWNGYHLPPAGMGDILVHGHTHIPEIQRHPSGIIIFNPGSAGKPRGGAVYSYGIFHNHTLSIHALADDAIIASEELNAES